MSKTAKTVFSISIAFLYSLAYTVVGPAMNIQDTSFKLSYIVSFLLCFPIMTAANFLAFTFIPKLKLRKAHDSLTRVADRIGDRKLFFIVWLFIFLCWVPAFLLLYPGVLSYDAISQTGSALTVINNNHHPFLHTWLLSVFMKFGYKHFGAYEHGIAIYSVLQMVVLSYALTRLSFLLKKKNVHALLVLLTILLSALWFVNAIFSVSMVKDTLHAAFLVLFVCHFTEIATNPSEYCGRKPNLFLLPIVVFLMCAFRNNGLHIYLFCIALLALIRIVHIKKIKAYIPLVIAIIVPIVAFKVYSGPVFEAWGINQGEVREALCVPIQQLQRVSALKYEELTDEQRATMMSYIIDCPEWMGYAHNRAYDPFSADPAKSCFYSAYYEENFSSFWKFYIKTGLQYPQTYVVAFLSNSLGYWYPGYYYYSYPQCNNYEAERFIVPLVQMPVWKSEFARGIYDSLCNSPTWREIPVIRLFIVPGFSLWFFLYLFAFSWKKKGFVKESLPLLLPLIAQLGIMFLCPIPSIRYSWPLYLLFPVAFLLTGHKTGSEDL